MSDELDRLATKIIEQPYEEHQIPEIERAIKLADEENDIKLSINLRYELMISSSCFNDGLKTVLYFPKYLWLLDNYPQYTSLDMQKNAVYCLRYMMSSTTDFYQISYEDREIISKEFKDRAEKYGFSLRFYYQCMTERYINDKNMVDAEICYKKYKASKRDNMSECKGCEKVFEMEYALNANDIKSANKIFNDLRINKTGCDLSKRSIYAVMIEYYFKTNQIEETKQYMKTLYRICKNYINGIDFMYAILLSYAVFEPKKGILIFEQEHRKINGDNNPNDQLKFYLSVWILFKVTKEKEGIENCKLNLSKDTPYFKEDGNYCVDDIIDYSKNIVLDLADKFDNRNRNNYYKNYIELLHNNISNFLDLQ